MQIRLSVYFLDFLHMHMYDSLSVSMLLLEYIFFDATRKERRTHPSQSLLATRSAPPGFACWSLADQTWSSTPGQTCNILIMTSISVNLGTTPFTEEIVNCFSSSRWNTGCAFQELPTLCLGTMGKNVLVLRSSVTYIRLCQSSNLHYQRFLLPPHLIPDLIAEREINRWFRQYAHSCENSISFQHAVQNKKVARHRHENNFFDLILLSRGFFMALLQKEKVYQKYKRWNLR